MTAVEPLTATSPQPARPPLRLVGDWPLAGLLSRMARDRRWELTRAAGDGAVRIEAGSLTAGLPVQDDLRRAIVAAGVCKTVAGCAEQPDAVDVTVVAPAAGRCGAAGHGPVDAVRIDAEEQWRIPDTGVPVRTRTFTVPQSRCWMAHLVLHGGAPPRPAGGILGIEPLAGADSSRIVQHMYDRGHGRQWTQVVLVDVVPQQGGASSAVVAFTDAPFVSGVLDALERGESPRC